MGPLPSRLGSLTVWNTSKCNFNCKYCFVYQLYEVVGETMSIETADALIHFAQHVMAPNGTIWFFGGEPFADFDSLKYIVEKAYANGVASTFGATTNLYLLDEKKIDWIKKYNFNILASIDGNAKIHNKHRVLKDGSGTWDVCWKNLVLFRKKTGRTPQLRWTIQTTDPEVLRSTPEAFKWILKQGFDNIAMDFVCEVDVDEYILKLVRQLMENLAEILDKCYSQNKWVFSMMVRDAFTAITNKTRINWTTRCGLAQGDVGVAPNGKIYPCHRFVASARDELLIGDVFRGFSPNRVRHNEEWARLPPHSEDPKLCLECKYKPGCMGGCLAQNYDMFADMHIVPKSFCLIKNLNVEVFEPLIRKHENFISQHLQHEGRTCIE